MFDDTIAALRASAEAAAAAHSSSARRYARERAQQRKVAAWRRHRDAYATLSRVALCANVRGMAHWGANAAAWRILAWAALADGDWHLALHYRRKAIEETAGVPLRVEVMR